MAGTWLKRLFAALLGLLALVAAFLRLRPRPPRRREPPAPLPGLREASPEARRVEDDADDAHSAASAEVTGAVHAPTAVEAAQRVKEALARRRGRGGGGVALVALLCLPPWRAAADPNEVSPEVEAAQACPLPADLPTGPVHPDECPESEVVTEATTSDGRPLRCVAVATPAWQAARDAAAHDQAECLRRRLFAVLLDRSEWYSRADALRSSLAVEQAARDQVEADLDAARSAHVWWAVGGFGAGVVVVVAIVVGVAETR